MERAVIVDIGANTGEFSRWMAILATVAARHHSRSHLLGQLEVTMLDPQPSMAPVLTNLVTDLRRRTPNVSVSFLPVAAWTRNDNMTFYSLRASQESSLMADGADASRMAKSGHKTIVPSIDLATWLLHGASFSDAFTLRLLKIDIEGAEYDLLPHLIVSGALCRATHLLVEWHLNKLPYSRRLRFLGLRLSFDELLTKGCQSSWAARRQANASFPRVIVRTTNTRATTSMRRYRAWKSCSSRTTAHGRPTAPNTASARKSKACLTAQRHQPIRTCVVCMFHKYSLLLTLESLDITSGCAAATPVHLTRRDSRAV